jgi:beta-lactamase class A
MKQSKIYFLGGLVTGLLCYFFGQIMYMHFNGANNLTSDLTPIRLSRFASTTDALIDPLFAVGNASTETPKKWRGLEAELQSTINASIAKGDVTEASVYFKDLQASEGFGINPDATYYPASLLKVPLMITYFKVAESDPSILKDEIYYGGEADANAQESLRSPIQIHSGSTYTVEQLIEHMVKNSDNNAAELLIAHLNDIHKSTTFNTLFTDLGFKELSTDDYLTPRRYSLFFRILYNSTYLSREYSERALKLLTQTDFSQGIESGVPNPITIAQKFGEYTVKDNKGTIIKRELHNCGIVYYPQKPYLLCVMTKGKDFTPLEHLIAEISRTIYSKMEEQN